MALFGRKSKDASTDATAGGGTATVAPAGEATPEPSEATAPAKGKKAKAAREPRPTKPKAIKNGTVVGLNIGNSYIKAVEVTNKGGELSITAMGAIATPSESISNGVVLSVNALADAIKELWKTAGFKSKTVITSVAGNSALVVRVIEVPKMTDGQLRDNMKVDADRYIPFPPSEVVMDFKALRELPSDPDAPNMEVLLAAAQREIVDLHIKAVQAARLDPRAIDVEPLAAVRAVEAARVRTTGDTYVNYNEVTALVNIGATGTEISVLRGDIVVFTRAVPNGGNLLTQAIADALGLPLTEAEQVKTVAADALPPQGFGTAGAQETGDFGGFESEFPDFGVSDDTQPINFDEFTTPLDDAGPVAPASAGSDDPFDLDFFNQGPKQDEPGTGHGQKEGDPNEENPFDFNFSFEDPAKEGATDETVLPSQAPTGSDPLPQAPAAGQAASEAAAGGTDPGVLPSRVPAAEPEALPLMPPAGDDWDDESLLPSIDTTVVSTSAETPAAAEPTPPATGEANLLPSRQSGATGPAEIVAESPAQPSGTEEAAVLPSVAPAGGWVPSAFDFSDLDLPSLDTTVQPSPGTAPVIREEVPHAYVPETPGTPAETPAAAPETQTPLAEAPVADAPVANAPVAGVSAAEAAVADAPVADASVAGGFSSFSFADSAGEGTSAAAAPAPTPTPAPAPAPANFGFAFVDAEPAAAATPAPPAEPAAPAPEEAAAAPAPAETFGGFSFSETPLEQPAGAAAAPAPQDTAAPVAFDAPTENFTLDQPAPAAESDATIVVPADEPSAAGSENSEDDFDLDAIFGTNAPGGEDVSATAPAAAPLQASAGDGDDTFFLGGAEDPLDLANIGGDAGGFAAFAGDADGLDTFGAGLTEDTVAGVDPYVLYGAVQPVVEELVSEVRRSLEFHLSRYPDATISGITLLGGGAELLNLDVYFTQMLGIPTQVATPFAGLAVNAPKLPEGYAQDNGPLCAVALGLALRDFVQ